MPDEPLPEVPRLDPSVMIEGYRLAKPKYIRARILACEIHANNALLSQAQRAYWKAIADGLQEILMTQGETP